MRQKTIELNVQDISIAGEAKEKELDGAFHIEYVVHRIAAAEALTSYGKLLEALVEASTEAELKEASQNFVSSFKNVVDKKLTDDQYEALGTIVQKVGGWLVEFHKAKAIKEIVPAASSDVNTVCDLLINDFSKDKLNLANSLNDAQRQLRADADVALAETKDFSDRALAINAYRQAVEVDQHLEFVASNAITTLATLKTANQQMVNALASDSVSIEDIKKLGKEISDLANAAKTVSGR